MPRTGERQTAGHLYGCVWRTQTPGILSRPVPSASGRRTPPQSPKRQRRASSHGQSRQRTDAVHHLRALSRSQARFVLVAVATVANASAGPFLGANTNPALALGALTTPVPPDTPCRSGHHCLTGPRISRSSPLRSGPQPTAHSSQPIAHGFPSSAIALPPAPRHNVAMARLRRRWRLAKWAGAVLPLPLGAAWVLSFWFWVGYATLDKWHAALCGGKVIVFVSIPRGFVESWNSRDGWFAERATTHAVQWMPRVSRSVSGLTISLPLWLPLLLIVVPTALVFWRDCRRIPPHCCQSCGYNLTGNISGTCPECGRPNSHTRA
jgi:hypothetical protein